MFQTHDGSFSRLEGNTFVVAFGRQTGSGSDFRVVVVCSDIGYFESVHRVEIGSDVELCDGMRDIEGGFPGIVRLVGWGVVWDETEDDIGEIDGTTDYFDLGF